MKSTNGRGTGKALLLRQQATNLFIAALLAALTTTTAVAHGHPMHRPVQNNRPVVWRHIMGNVNLHDSMITAVQDDDLVMLRLLFTQGATANFIDTGGTDQTPLIVAALETHVDEVRFLLAHGADVNGTDAHGNTCLALVEKRYPRSHVPIIQAILQTLKRAGALVKGQQNVEASPTSARGADVAIHPRTQSANGVRPVVKTPVIGNIKLADQVMSAVADGDMAMLQFLFAHGADANYLDDSTMPLVMAADSGHPDVVRFLLAHGAEVTSENDGDATSLDLAENDEKRAADPVERVKYAEIITLLKQADEKK